MWNVRVFIGRTATRIDSSESLTTLALRLGHVRNSLTRQSEASFAYKFHHSSSYLSRYIRPAHHLIWYYKPVQSFIRGQSFRIFSTLNISEEFVLHSFGRSCQLLRSFDMRKLGPWITNFFVIIAVAFATGADAASELTVG